MNYVFVLFSRKDHKFHVGLTPNLERTILAHEAGQVAVTKDRRPLELVSYEAYEDLADARERLRFLRSTHGERTLRLQHGHYVSVHNGFGKAGQGAGISARIPPWWETSDLGGA